ncbi:MAG: hypothetical protein AAB176_00250 [Pseudomonadota bacterium]|jgi:hypothetical protein
MTHLESAVLAEPPSSVVPVLSEVILDAQIPQALRAALDAREQERAAFMALADELVQELRPELERLTSEWVQRSLRRAWAHRAPLDLD